MSTRVKRQRSVDQEVVDVCDADTLFSAHEIHSSLNTMLFCHPSMQPLADEIARQHPAKVQLGKVAWARFPDGSPNLAIDPEDARLITHEHVRTMFLGNFTDARSVFDQIAIIYALARSRCRGFKVLVPYFSTGTMDRVDTPGQVATSATLARILSATPACATGPTTVVVYDIHALQEQFYFSDQVQVELKSAVYLLRQQLFTKLPKSELSTISIAFPDDGAAKRFKTKFPELPIIVCSKVRVGDERRVTVTEGEAAGRHCVIVDDLVQSGGTLLECAICLKALGAARVSCFVTHAIFPGDAWKKFMHTEGGANIIDKIWITDTVPQIAEAVAKVEPFEVLSIAPLVGHLLTGDGVLTGDGDGKGSAPEQ